MGDKEFNLSEKKIMIEKIRKIFPSFNPKSLSDEQLINTYKTFIGINQEIK